MPETIFDNPFNFVLALIQNWWWVFLPFIAFHFFRNAWLWKIREAYEKKQKYRFMEMIVPNEVEKPLYAMEQVFANVWPIHSTLDGRMNLKKKYWHGRKPDYFTIEIVTTGGVPRFFLRLNEKDIDTIEAAFFAQFPGMEFREAKDLLLDNVSWNAPDDRWNLYGFDITLLRPDVYPIKTYNQFFEQKPENTKEEKRIDPINTLIESLRKISPNEKALIQIRLEPISEVESDHIQRGRALVNKLVNRKTAKGSGIFSFFFGSGKTSQDRELIPPEMKLTPREREIVQLVENKIGKYSYRTNIRCILLGEKRFFDPSRKKLLEEYFSSFSAPDLNTMKKMSQTKTKIQYFFTKRRLFLRKKNIFFRYLLRERPFYPKRGGTFILNIEELATIFHPPINSVLSAAFVERISAKKGESPNNLPIE